MTTATSLTSAPKRLTEPQQRKLEEHTARFESAAGGDSYVPMAEPDKMSQDLARMEALFKRSCKS